MMVSGYTRWNNLTASWGEFHWEHPTTITQAERLIREHAARNLLLVRQAAAERQERDQAALLGKERPEQVRQLQATETQLRASTACEAARLNTMKAQQAVAIHEENVRRVAAKTQEEATLRRRISEEIAAEHAGNGSWKPQADTARAS